MNLTIILITIFCNLSASQFWHAEKITQSFSDKLSLTFEDDFRSESFGENNYYFHGDVSLKYKLSSAIFFNANFREVFEKKSSGWVQEHRPHGTVSMKKKFGLISTTGRVRMEYRIKDSGSTFRNRNMLTLDFGNGWTSMKLVPYLAEELFYNLADKEINRNRFYVGVHVKKITVYKPTRYFIQLRILKNNKWESFGVLGIKISF